jgi:uncharacterized protein
MLYRPFGRTGEKVSALGFGCMRLPVLDEANDRIDVPLATAMLEYAIDQGVNYVDTAYPYHGTSHTAPGQSEPFVGQALSGGLRDRVLLATKLPSWLVQTRADMDRILAEQLQRLQTDRIDCYLLHGLNGPSWEHLRKEGAIDFLEEAKAAGRIRYAGFSFHGEPEHFAPIVGGYDFDFCQIQYNYMDTEYQAGRAGLRHAAGKGMGVVIMEPLRGGSLVKRVPNEVQAIWDRAPVRRSPAEWGLRFVWDDPAVSVVLSGMGTMEQMVENVRSATTAAPQSLLPAELDAIAQATDAYRARCRVECTGCAYCMPCPQGVNIPGVFEVLNDVHFYEDPKLSRIVYGMQFGANGKASDCVECGECEDECPQHIAIRETLKEAARLLE